MTDASQPTLPPPAPSRGSRDVAQFLPLIAVALLALTTLFTLLTFLGVQQQNSREKEHAECSYKYDNSGMEYDSDEYNSMESKRDNCVANIYGIDD